MKKTTGAVLGRCATGPLLLAVPILAAVAEQVKAILDGGDKGSVSVPGLEDPADQVPNAKTIQATGVAMDLPRPGQVAARATALQGAVEPLLQKVGDPSPSPFAVRLGRRR